MTPYLLKLVNWLQSYVSFYRSYCTHYFDKHVKGHSIDIVQRLWHHCVQSNNSTLYHFSKYVLLK